MQNFEPVLSAEESDFRRKRQCHPKNFNVNSVANVV